jgi:CheY-like chemotaxis protein/ribosome-associated translation inhibitor RaiA
MNPEAKQSRTSARDRLPCVVLAEDDLEMRKLLSWSLERLGYNVVECADGNSLMRKLGLHGPGTPLQPHDLIISDIRMPGATGLQVLESARELPDFPPMILITAFPDAQSREQAMRLGAAAMLAKPFEIEELLEEVREIIPPEPLTRRRSRVWFESGEQPSFPLEITFRHDSGSEAAKDYIRSISTKLHPFADYIVNCRVIVDQSDKLHHKKHRYMLTLVLSTTGRSIAVKHNTDKDATSENLYLAINVAFGTAARKLKHYIKKRQEHRKQNKIKQPFQEADELDDDVEA